jgi:hypothetical protein
VPTAVKGDGRDLWLWDVGEKYLLSRQRQVRYREDPSSSEPSSSQDEDDVTVQKKQRVGHDVDISSDKAFTLLKRGQEVETPLGPGRIDDIEIQAGRYGKRIELEPPVISVELDKPKPGQPKVVTVCMCKLGLEDPAHETIIKKEFSRLWPPISDEIPEEAMMLIDHQEEFQKKTGEFLQRVEAAAEHDPVELVKQYCHLASLVEGVRCAAQGLNPGAVIRDLEGVDLAGEDAVVMKTEPMGDSVQVTLYLPEHDTIKIVKVPSSSKTVSREPDVGVVPTVYDPERLNSPELHNIRTLPDSYLRPDPNYPSSLRDIWRPTMRVTPVRFYNYRDAGFPFKPENDPDEERHWPPQDYTNYPTPDTVRHEPTDQSPPIFGIQLYEYDPERRHPDHEHCIELAINDDKKLKELSEQFWKQYQAAQPHDVHLRPDVHDFAMGFAEQESMDEDEIVDLVAYMAAKGILQRSTVDQFLDHLWTQKTTLNTRTHYNNK